MNDSIDLVLDDAPRKFHLEDANKLSKILKIAPEVFFRFIEVINAAGECHFTHKMAYGNVLETVVNERSEALLDEMYTYYPSIFEEPKYPITQNRIPFSIPLVDEKLPPPKHKLYPLSEPDLRELHK